MKRHNGRKHGCTRTAGGTDGRGQLEGRTDADSYKDGRTRTVTIDGRGQLEGRIDQADILTVLVRRKRRNQALLGVFKRRRSLARGNMARWVEIA